MFTPSANYQDTLMDTNSPQILRGKFLFEAVIVWGPYQFPKVFFVAKSTI